MKELLGIFGLALQSMWVALRNRKFSQVFDLQPAEVASLTIEGSGLSTGVDMEPMSLTEANIQRFFDLCDAAKAGNSTKVRAEYLVTIHTHKAPDKPLRFHVTRKLIRKRSAASDIRRTWFFKEDFSHTLFV